MRKVFLEDLPRWGIGGKAKVGYIDWSKSKGYKVNGIYDNINFEMEIIDYKEGYLYIKYLDNPIFKIATSGLKSCKVGSLLEKHTGEFKIKIGQILKDSKRDIIITDKEYRKDNSRRNFKWYKYTCNICGWTEGWMVESNLIRGSGCSCCKGITIVEGINDIPTTDNWMVKYFQGGYDEAKRYSRCSHSNIYPICTDCSRIKDKAMPISSIHKYDSINCTCSDKISYPNKLSYSLLDQLNKIYKFDYLEHEYSPEWIGRRSYDNYFVCNGKGYILEMDGGFHFKDNKMSGQTKEKSKEIDDYKDRIAREHGLEVIRIDCTKSDLKFIKQSITNSRLNSLFDLVEIDWIGCDKFALSNLVKVACAYWKDGIESTLEISKIMKLDRSTIVLYLKKGSKYKWCSYDSKEEIKKIGIKYGKARRKTVEIFEDDISLGVFPSCIDLEGKSEELFGVKLGNSAISSVCRGERHHHKGFTFKYIKQIEQAV